MASRCAGIILLAACVWAAAAAAGPYDGQYTLPGAAPYDSLVATDHGGMPFEPWTVHVNVGVGYWKADQTFDAEGGTADLTSEPYFITVPINAGYAPNEWFLADATIPVVRPSALMGVLPSAREQPAEGIGIGDVWLKGRAVFEPWKELFVGPRLAVKFPVGKVDYDDDKPELGDGQFDLDFAVVVAKFGYLSPFIFNGQLGYRRRLAKTVAVPDANVPGLTAAAEYLPGALAYAHVEPGVGFGPGRIYNLLFPVGYAYAPAGTLDGETIADGAADALYAGLYGRYMARVGNFVGLKATYTLAGSNVPRGLFVAFTYEAFFPVGL